MSSELWIAILTFLTTVFGGARWLFQVRHNQTLKEQKAKANLESQVENLKNENHVLLVNNIQSQLDQLKIISDGLKNEMGGLKAALENMRDELKVMDNFSKGIHKLFADREAKQKIVNDAVIKLSDELIILKGVKKNG